ncbi:2567_t:CDS:2, partial [Gigaspora rosea]
LEIDETSQFSKQSKEFYASLISIRDANKYGDDLSMHICKNQALISCLEPSEFSDFSEDLEYWTQPSTSSSAKHPHVAGPILDQQQAVNIFCNYQ